MTEVSYHYKFRRSSPHIVDIYKTDGSQLVDVGTFEFDSKHSFVSVPNADLLLLKIAAWDREVCKNKEEDK